MDARFAIFESTPTGPNYRFGNFRFLKNNKRLSFLKNFEKITKNVISRKLQRNEQSYLEARSAIIEITLTGSSYRFGNFRFLKNNKRLSFLKNFEKITKNVISRKLQRNEQSYLEARSAIIEITLTGSSYRVANFRFLKSNKRLSFLKNFEKITKNVISRKLQRNEQSYLEARSAIIEITLTGSSYRVANFRFLKNHKRLSFLKNFEKITKNVISRKLQRNEQSYLEARSAIIEITLTGSSYRVANFRFCGKKLT